MTTNSSGRHLCASVARAIRGSILWGIRVEALVHVIASLVTALAATAFAHFGVTLKVPVQRQPESRQVIRRVPVSDPAAAPMSATRGMARPILAQTEQT